MVGLRTPPLLVDLVYHIWCLNDLSTSNKNNPVAHIRLSWFLMETSFCGIAMFLVKSYFCN
jgi:hypothetical protein